MKYHAFISYSHADRQWAEWLHRGLETYRLPEGLREENEGLPERFFPVFRDRDELAGASVLGARLQEALRESRFLIVVCSPRSAKSEWVEKEVGYFKQLGRAEQVLCLIVDGVPKATLRRPDETERECYPRTILHPVDEEGEPILNVWEEPLAADARPGGDGKRAALLKIIAGMAGVGYGDLVRRDQQRAIRRLRWLVAGTTALVLAFAVLGVALFFQRQEAIAQKMEALRQRDMARTVRDGAQELGTYVIGDLRSKLRDLGRLDLLDDATRRVLEYHEGLPDELADDPAVMRARAMAMDYAGQLAMAQGRSDEAVRLLEVSREAWLRLMEREEDREQAWNGFAISATMLAEAHTTAGDLESARRRLDEGLLALERCGRGEPGVATMRMRTEAMMRTDLGGLLLRMGNISEARENLERGASLAKEAVEGAPDLPGGWRQAAVSFGEHALFLRKEGELELALGQAKAGLDAASVYAEMDLESAIGWMTLEQSGKTLFNCLARLESWEEAEVAAKDRVGWINRMMGRDPMNPSLKAKRAIAHDDLAVAYWKQGEILPAAEEFQKAIHLLADLIQQHPTRTDWRKDLAIVFKRRGDMAYEGEVWDVAMDDYDASLRMRESLIRLSPEDKDQIAYSASVMVARAEVLHQTGRSAEALGALDEAEERLGMAVGVGKLADEIRDGIAGARRQWKGRD